MTPSIMVVDLKQNWGDHIHLIFKICHLSSPWITQEIPVCQKGNKQSGSPKREHGDIWWTHLCMASEEHIIAWMCEQNLALTKIRWQLILLDRIDHIYQFTSCDIVTASNHTLIHDDLWLHSWIFETHPS